MILLSNDNPPTHEVKLTFRRIRGRHTFSGALLAFFLFFLLLFFTSFAPHYTLRETSQKRRLVVSTQKTRIVNLLKTKETITRAEDIICMGWIRGYNINANVRLRRLAVLLKDRFTNTYRFLFLSKSGDTLKSIMSDIALTDELIHIILHTGRGATVRTCRSWSQRSNITVVEGTQYHLWLELTINNHRSVTFRTVQPDWHCDKNRDKNNADTVEWYNEMRKAFPDVPNKITSRASKIRWIAEVSYELALRIVLENECGRLPLIDLAGWIADPCHHTNKIKTGPLKRFLKKSCDELYRI